MVFILCQISMLKILILKMSAGLVRVGDLPMDPAKGLGEGISAYSTASLEYIRVEENRQRSIVLRRL